MNPNTHVNFRQLVSRLVDGIATPEQLEELERLLKESRAARDFYRDYIGLHTELERRPTAPLPQEIMEPRSPGVLWLLAAAAVVALAAVGLWKGGGVGGGDSQVVGGGEAKGEEGPSAASPGVAMVRSAENLLGSNGAQSSLKPGEMVGRGVVEFATGTLQLDFLSGSRMTLLAPFRMDVMGPEEVYLQRGQLAARAEIPGLIVRFPTGAVVDLGTEFSVNVGEEGLTEVMVFEGAVEVSRSNRSGSTREAVRLAQGESIQIGERFELLAEKGTEGFLRQPRREIPAFDPASAYVEAVKRSGPVGYWRFEDLVDGKAVRNEMAGSEMVLRKDAILAGPSGSKFLYTDTVGAAGFVEIGDPLVGMNGPAGCSLELWYYSESGEHGTIAALELAGDLRTVAPPRPVKHPPGLLVLERTGLAGSKIGHVHPDFSVRYLYRSPPGYIGGINSYSMESHLLNRWVQVVAVRDAERIRLFVDGRLSDELEIGLPQDDLAYHLILGRLHAYEEDDLRQWVGGIDEVSIYRRALTADEVVEHYEAARR